MKTTAGPKPCGCHPEVRVECPELLRLRDAKRETYQQLMDAHEDLDSIRPGDQYGATDAHARYREAEENHEAARRRYLHHRLHGSEWEDEENPGGD